MFLFDTDVLSNIVKRRPSGLLMKKLARLPKQFQYTTAINIGEIYYGASRSARKDQIIRAFDEKVFPNVIIVGFDETSGRIFGELKAELQKNGLSCSEPDLRIAAIAIQHEMVLITGNTRHFTNIPGLRVENWIRPD